MSNETICVTGDRGFVARYVITELLDKGFDVVGVDDGSKHGFPDLPYDDEIEHYEVDLAWDPTADFFALLDHHDVDRVVATASLIGGISYFHKRASGILETNNKITANTIEACVEAEVEQLVMFSSSMVYESAEEFPVEEGQEREIPPPETAYGFQKLSTEYSVEAAKKQYDLDYTIVRPFNAVGAGEKMDPEEKGFAHVIPDFIHEAKTAEDEFDILGSGEQIRSFTHAEDIARGVRMCLEQESALNDDFNFVTHSPLPMKDLARKIWNKIRDEDFPGFSHLEAFEGDVQQRDGCHDKAEEVLGWTPNYDLDEILDETIHYLESDEVDYGGSN